MTENTTFTEEVNKYHEKLLSYIRGLVFNFKRTHGLNEKEMAEIFKIKPELFSEFMHESWEGYVDSRFLSILHLLTEREFEFEHVIYKPCHKLHQVVENYIEECTKERHNRMLGELFEVLGIENDDDLETAVKLLKNAISENKKDGKEETD